MYFIKIFSDFCSSEKCKENVEKIYNVLERNDYGPRKKIYFTNEDIYTHAIIINQAMPELAIPKKNVIGLAFEPYELLKVTHDFIQYAKKNIGKYYIGTNHQLPEPFIEGFSFMWFANPKREIPLREKKRVMSIIVSEKKYAPGHIYRHQLVEHIIRNRLPIDIYGRGSHLYKSDDNRIKGEFHDESPYQNYMFSVCIENFRNPHYFSEKIMSPIMYNCMPLYWGCKNIFYYFDEVILLTGHVETDIKLLLHVLKDPMKFYKPTYTEKNKKQICLLDQIETLF